MIKHHRTVRFRFGPVGSNTHRRSSLCARGISRNDFVSDRSYSATAVHRSLVNSRRRKPRTDRSDSNAIAAPTTPKPLVPEQLPKN